MENISTVATECDIDLHPMDASAPFQETQLSSLNSINSFETRPGSGDIFFNNQGCKLMAIECLIDTVRRFVNGDTPAALTYERNWLMGYEKNCAVTGPLCFSTLGGSELDTADAAKRFIEAVEMDPQKLEKSLRELRVRVREGEGEFASEDINDMSVRAPRQRDAYA